MVNVAGVGGQIGRAAGDDRRGGGHLHWRSVDHIVGGYHSIQRAGGGRLAVERHGEQRRGRRRDTCRGPVVESDRIVAVRRGIETEADDRTRLRASGRQEILPLLAVTTGAIVATCVALPAALLVVTVAFRLPTAVGAVVIEMVSVVAVAELIVPAAPSVKLTESLAFVGSNP